MTRANRHTATLRAGLHYARALASASASALTFASALTRGRAFARALALALAIAAPDARAQGRPLDAPQAFDVLEGALQNDSFVPTSAIAAQRLASGDQAWEELARIAGDKDAARKLTEAFEAWRSALVESDALDSVGASLPTAGFAPELTQHFEAARVRARRTEAVEIAVVRRLRLADVARARAWRERFGALAELELSAAHENAQRLARVERDNPRTQAAARAALVLSEIAFESGAATQALSWLERARAHLFREVDLERENERASERALAAAIDRRRALVQATLPSDFKRARGSEPWHDARRLRLVTTIPLDETQERPDATADDVRPGVVFLDPRRFAVQGREHVSIVEADALSHAFELRALVADRGWKFTLTTGKEAWPWPLLPASSQGLLVLVAGRALAARGNALVCVDPGSRTQAPAVLWGYADQGFESSIDGRQPLAELLGPGLWEFEPGPAIDGALVLAQARQWIADGASAATIDEGRVRAWCIAFELSTGRVRWKRLLATGADIEASRTRRLRGGARQHANAAQPLAAAEGRVFVPTALGIGALLDTCDGRLCWSVRTRRRALLDPGWRSASAPIRFTPSQADAGRGGDGWTWAPADSDFLYRLVDGPDLDGRGVFLDAPRAIGDGLELAGADDARIVLLTRALERTALAQWSIATGARADSIAFGREEELPGALPLSPTRALAATDRALYLFDRGRDLALLDEFAWPDRARGSAGVFARAARVIVVRPTQIAIFATE